MREDRSAVVPDRPTALRADTLTLYFTVLKTQNYSKYLE